MLEAISDEAAPLMSGVALDVDELTSRVTALFAHVPGVRVENLDQFVGGASSLTYAADLHDSDGSRRVIVKAAPPGLEPVRNRDVLRQVKLLRLLADVPDVAVPRVLAEDPGAPVEVPPLFVMEFVEGESYEPYLTSQQSSATADEISRRARAAARMAAALHRVDTSDPRLAGETVISIEDEVHRWDKAFGSVGDDLRAGADGVRDALLRDIPAEFAPAVIHGDWRLGNMQCSVDSIHAVIDWEIWSLEDPRIDLAWFLMMADPAHPSSIRSDASMPTPEELTAAYEEASGRPMPALDWFAALVRYKQAAISALIIKNNRKRPQPGVNLDRIERARAALLVRARALLS